MIQRLYFIFTFIFIQNLFSQGSGYDLSGEANVNYLPQAFTIQPLGSFGYSNTTQINTFNLGNSNPASLSTIDSFSFGLSFQMDSKIDPAWIADKNLKATYTGHKRIHNYLPQSFGFSVPMSSLKLGIAYNQLYNTALLFQPYTLLFTSPENPNGILKTFQDESETLVSEFAFLGAYLFKNLFLQNDEFSFGIKLRVINTDQFNKIMTSEFNENYSGFSWSVGGSYQLAKKEKSNLSFGLFYDHSFSEKAKYDESRISGIDGLYYVTNLPSKIHFGLSGNTINELRYNFNLSYIFWESVPANSYILNKNLKNQVEFSGNIFYQISKTLFSTIGVYTTDRVFKEKPSKSFVDEFSSVFIIFGVTTYFKNFDLSAILADSHLLSDELRKQTVFKLGTNFKF